MQEHLPQDSHAMQEAAVEPQQLDDPTKSGNRWLLPSVYWLAIALALVAACFAYSVHRREPYVTQAIKAEYWTRQSAMTLSIARNWYEESPVEHGFIMYWSPSSPAQQTIKQRNPYIRFPFGAPVPIYLWAHISGTPPNLSMLVNWNLAIQFATAMICSLLAWSVLSVHRVPPLARLMAVVFAGLTYSLSDMTLIGHSLDYFCTEAMVPLYALAILLEYWRLHVPARSMAERAVRFLLPLVVLAGCLTDWFMFIVVFVLLARRWLMRSTERPGTAADNLALLVIPAAALGFLAWQVASVGGYEILWLKFLQRTGLDPRLSGSPNVSLLKGFYHRALGLQNTFLILGSLMTLVAMQMSLRRYSEIVDSRSRAAFLDVAGCGFLLAVPCLLHAHALSEHYSIHGDDALKFMVVIALLPFILLPLASVLWLQALRTKIQMPVANLDVEMHRDFREVSGIVLGIAVFVGLGFSLLPSYTNWQGRFVDQSAKVSSADISVARLLRTIAKPDDLCFSPNLRITDELDDLPKTALSRKVVYQLKRASELAAHPAIAAARSNGANFRLLLVVDRSIATYDWKADFSENLGRHILESKRFSVWELLPPKAPKISQTILPDIRVSVRGKE